MKLLLLPLLAAIALPTAVNAETWWLMAAGKSYQGGGATSNTWAIPTSSEKECEQAGQKFLNAVDAGDYPNTVVKKNRGYVCVKGK